MSEKNILLVVEACKRCINNYNYYNVLGIDLYSDGSDKINEIRYLYHPDQEVYILSKLPTKYHEIYKKIKEDYTDMIEVFTDNRKKEEYDKEIRKISNKKLRLFKLEREAEFLLNNKIKVSAKEIGWTQICIALFYIIEYKEIVDFKKDLDGTNRRLENTGVDVLRSLIIKKSNNIGDFDSWEFAYNYLSYLFSVDLGLKKIMELLDKSIIDTCKNFDDKQCKYALKHFINEKGKDRADYLDIYDKKELCDSIKGDDVDALIRIRLNQLRLENNNIFFDQIFRVELDNIIDLYISELKEQYKVKK